MKVSWLEEREKERELRYRKREKWVLWPITKGIEKEGLVGFYFFNLNLNLKF